jgi:hypothetical protein
VKTLKRFHRFKLDFCVQGTGTIFNEEALEEIAEDQGVETQEVKKQFSSPIGKILQILILLTPALISPARPMLTDYAQRTPLYVQIDNLDENNVKMFYNPNYELKRKTFLIPVDESEFTAIRQLPLQRSMPQERLLIEVGLDRLCPTNIAFSC